MTCIESGVDFETFQTVAVDDVHTIVNKTTGLVTIGITTYRDVGKGGDSTLVTWHEGQDQVNLNSGESVDFTATVAGTLAFVVQGGQLDRTALHVKA
jgi:hypothetical protein